VSADGASSLEITRTLCHRQVRLSELTFRIRTSEAFSKVHQGILHTHPSSHSFKIKTEISGHVAQMEEMRNAYNSLIGKPEGKRLLGRPRSRWEDDTRINLRGTGWEGINWMHLAQDRDKWRSLVSTVMNLQVP